MAGRPALRTAVDRVLVARIMVPLAYAISAGWLAWQSSHVDSYIWLIDELLYLKNALGYASLDGLLPTVHGVRNGPPNILYPLLLAPALGLLDSETGFTVAHVLNGLVYASALFPAYLLARRLGATWGWALLAGLITVWAPWNVASLVLTTEVLAYPLSIWAVLAIVRAVAEPGPRSDLIACVAIAAAILARTQLVILAGVFVLAIVVDQLARRDTRSWRERLYPHRLLVGAAAVIVLLFAVVTVTGSTILEGYGATTDKPPLPPGWLGSTLTHAARIFVGVGILPALLFVAWVLHAGARPRDAFERAGVVVCALAVPLFLYEAGFFAQNIAGGVVQERYVLYIVPLIAVGAVVLASDRLRPAPRLSLVGAVVVVAGVVGIEGYSPGIAAAAFGRTGSAGAAYYEVLSPKMASLATTVLGRPGAAGEGVVIATIGLGVLALLAFSVRSRVRSVAVPVLLVGALLFCVVESRWVIPRVIIGIGEVYPSTLPGVNEQPRDWVDRALPDGADAAILPGSLGVPDESGQWLWTEFWNKRIRQGLSLRDLQTPYTGWPAVRLRVDPSSGAVRAAGVLEHVVLSENSPTVGLEGQVVERSAYGAVLLRAEQPLRATHVADGTDENGRFAGAGPIVLRVFGARPERVTVELAADGVGPDDGDVAVPVTVRGAGRARAFSVAAGKRRRVTVRPRADGTVELSRRPVALDETRRIDVRLSAIARR